MIDLDAIRLGLERGEFFLEYLPTLRLSDGACLGAAALIRWRRPEGVVPPLDFIPQIERTPLSGLVTYWTMETAAAELGGWLRGTDGVHVAFNIPPELLGRGALEFVARKAGLADLAGKLVLEITERGIPDQIGVDALASRSGPGRFIRIAIDDVGTDSNGVAALARAHFDIIKLDKSVTDQVAGGATLPLVQAVVAMANASRAEVVAEGVEREEQRKVLEGAGVHMAQGWLFSRSLPAAGFLEFAERNARGGSV